MPDDIFNKRKSSYCHCTNSDAGPEYEKNCKSFMRMLNFQIQNLQYSWAFTHR